MKLLIFGVIVILALGVGGMFYAAHHEPPCRTLWSNHYTGRQRVDDHEIQCSHGLIVRVYR